MPDPWFPALGVQVVTLYMLSTDNLNRAWEQLDLLTGIIANTLDRLDEDADISRFLDTRGQPDPDLVIRTSGAAFCRH